MHPRLTGFIATLTIAGCSGHSSSLCDVRSTAIGSPDAGGQIADGTYIGGSVRCDGSPLSGDAPSLVIQGTTGTLSTELENGSITCTVNDTFTLAYPSPGAITLTLQSLSCNGAPYSYMPSVENDGGGVPACVLDPGFSCNPLFFANPVMEGTYTFDGSNIRLTLTNTGCVGGGVDAGPGMSTEEIFWSLPVSDPAPCQL
jgi:hypothetical protein